MPLCRARTRRRTARRRAPSRRSTTQAGSTSSSRPMARPPALRPPRGRPLRPPRRPRCASARYLAVPPPHAVRCQAEMAVAHPHDAHCVLASRPQHTDDMSRYSQPRPCEQLLRTLCVCHSASIVSIVRVHRGHVAGARVAAAAAGGTAQGGTQDRAARWRSRHVRVRALHGRGALLVWATLQVNAHAWLHVMLQSPGRIVMASRWAKPVARQCCQMTT